MSSINLAVPFFSQRENTYVWYQCDEYGNRLKDKNGKEKLGISMAWCSCNITHGVKRDLIKKYGRQ